MVTHRLTWTERQNAGERFAGSPGYPPPRDRHHGLRRGYRRRVLDLELDPEQVALGAEVLAAQHCAGDLISDATLTALLP